MQHYYMGADHGQARGWARQPAWRPHPTMGLDRVYGARRRMYGAEEFAPNPPSAGVGTVVYPGQMPPAQQQLLQEIALAESAGGMVVDPRVPLDAYLQPAPIPSTDIISGASATISVRPEFTFGLRRLFIPSTVGPYWLVDNVTVGRIPQFVSEGSIGAEAFSEVATKGLGLKGDTCTLGQAMTITVTNNSTLDRTFVGAGFYGLVGR